MKYSLGIDIGGTFTDFALLEMGTGNVLIHKILTTPRDPSAAVLGGIKELLDRARVGIEQVEAIVHGTTLVTNVTIERKGAEIGMLVTEGFRDALEIGKEQRYEATDLRLEFPRPLVSRPNRVEIAERTHFDGRIETELALDEVRRRIDGLIRDRQIEAIAVCFLHSYANPTHERLVQALIEREYPDLYLSVSSDVSPFIREYERWTTTTVNAYSQPMVDRYLRVLETGAARMGFQGELFIMTSNGGTSTPEIARRFPVRMIESGPVAGALMSAYHSRQMNEPNVLSFDMGGTTAKGTIIQDHVPLRRDEIEIAHVYGYRKGSGLPLRIPVVDMIEIGAGGGSVAKPDARGVIAVGPQSAGADPGPACYDRGGRDATLTDANLYLGYLNADFFLGGKMKLALRRSEEVIGETVAAPLGLDIMRAAWGIHETVNEDVARAFRMHAAQRGFDYRSCSMVAFGGSGPIHALRIARKLRIPRVVFPAGAGVMSAFGLLASPVNHEIVRTEHMALDEATADAFTQKFELLTRQVCDYVRAAGVPERDITVSLRLDMRYVGQGYEIELPLPEGALPGEVFRDLPARFAKHYESVFSTSFGDWPSEIVNWKAQARGPQPVLGRNGYVLSEFEDEKSREALKGHRSAFIPERGESILCSVYDRYALPPGTKLEGPALIEENESTCVIGEGDKVVVDDRHNLIAEIVAG